MAGPALALSELEILELCRDVADDFDIPQEHVRPCIAYLLNQGVGSEREPYAWTLSHELFCAGVRGTKLTRALRQFNDRLPRKLFPGELAKVIRRAESGRYSRPYSCRHTRLQAVCVGSVCPWRKNRQGAPRGNVLTQFFALGWPACLSDAYASVLYLGLTDLSQRQGVPLGQPLSFNYSRLKDVTGLNGNRISERLKVLQSVGLIDVEIGTAWGSAARKQTRVSIIWPMPTPDAQQYRTGTIPNGQRQYRSDTKTRPASSAGAERVAVPERDRVVQDPCCAGGAVPASVGDTQGGQEGTTRRQPERGNGNLRGERSVSELMDQEFPGCVDVTELAG